MALITGTNSITIDSGKLNKTFKIKFKPILEVLNKINKNREQGAKIRGQIILDVIFLDELMESIILEKYVVPDLHDDIKQIILSDERFSSQFKMSVLRRGKTINKKTAGNIGVLLNIRNIVAHSKPNLILNTLEVLYKGKVKDITSLKTTFDKIFEETIKILDKILDDLEKNKSTK